MEVKPGYKQTEVGVIPADWEACPVSRKGEVVTGKALAATVPGQHRPYLRTKNVFDGRIDVEDVLTMPMTDQQFEHFRLKAGDVLLNEGQSLDLVGRCAIYSDEYPEPCAIQNQLLRFRARTGVSPVFASYLFRYCQQRGVFANIALQTTSIAHLGASRFEQLCLAWPRTEVEQRAIAEALSDVDALLGGLGRLISKKRDLKQAAMQQLLTGQTRLPGFEGEWGVKTLGEVFEISSSKRVFQSEWRSEGIPFYRARELAVLGQSGLVDNELFISRTLYEKHRRAYGVPSVGDMLVTGVGTIGKVYVVSDDREFYFKDGNIIWFKIEAKMSAEFLRQLYLTNTVMKQVAEGGAGTTVGTYTISAAKKTAIPFPTLGEQTAIAEVLTEMDAEIAALKQRREKTSALKQGMMQELLTGKTRLI